MSFLLRLILKRIIMFSRLYNLYWFIRFTRIKVVKRRYYRLVTKERKRLLEEGVNDECLRLLCRHLSNLRNSSAEERYLNYRKNCQFCR